MNGRVPITRLNKFFSAEDRQMDEMLGMEWLHGDMNFTLVLYRIDRLKTKTDDVYGETPSDGIKYLPPVEFNGYVQIFQPENKNVGNSKINKLVFFKNILMFWILILVLVIILDITKMKIGFVIMLLIMMEGLTRIIDTLMPEQNHSIEQ